jgi:hypothetical protein
MFILAQNRQNVVIEPFTTIHNTIMMALGLDQMSRLWKAQE